MNHLLARTKGRDGGFFKVISDRAQFFELPDDLGNTVEYNSDYRLADDEWFAIEEFSTKEFSIDIVMRQFASTEYNQIAVADYLKIDYLMAYQGGMYYFQKLSSSQVIEKKYFTISQEPSLVNNQRIIVIDRYPDAIYIRESDTLYFKRLTSIAAIFRGIDQLYKEATQEETEKFLKNKFIQLADDYSAEKVKKANRRRIAMAMETLNNFSKKDKEDIVGYIREYCEDLNFDEDKNNFSISNEDELKKLLYGIEQRYYTTLLGGERRLANSITLV